MITVLNLCTSAAVQVSGEAAFPLLDLRVDFHERAVEQLMEVYERSQDSLGPGVEG